MNRQEHETERDGEIPPGEPLRAELRCQQTVLAWAAVKAAMVIISEDLIGRAAVGTGNFAPSSAPAAWR